MTNKTANILVRIEPEIKKEAEDIINELGLTPSIVINMLYRQIIFQRGIPFEVKLPSDYPLVAKLGEE